MRRAFQTSWDSRFSSTDRDYEISLNKCFCVTRSYTLDTVREQIRKEVVGMIDFGDAFTIVQSLMTFLIVTDVFYERIIQNKLLPKMSPNVSLLGIKRNSSEKIACGKCLLRDQHTANTSSAGAFPTLPSITTSGKRGRRR